ncbi:MAG TPA: hypothetical protein VFH89_14445 [Sphingomicrobium sp.]|nr:hypothetical protein [Sphingomicrobium sp.]
MTAILIIGVVRLVIGGAFFWLNLNSPVQTSIPAYAIPIGVILIAVAVGGLLL